MTVKLYDDNPYISDFDSQVISFEKKSESTIDIVLKETAFFPEAGGQSPDLGVLQILSLHQELVLNVVDVQIEDEVIHHICQLDPEDSNYDLLKPQVAIHGSIDFRRRHSFMKSHSAEHIISGIIHSMFGYDNVGFHLSENICTCDYNGPLDKIELRTIEMMANSAIQSNVNIKCYYPDEKDLDNLNYRSKDGISGPVRLVEISPYDLCACCAPHVKQTGEIGIVLITDAISYKGGTRLTLETGLDALYSIFYMDDALNSSSRLLSTKTRDIPDAIEKLMASRDSYRLEAMNAARDGLFSKLELAKIAYEKDISPEGITISPRCVLIESTPCDNKVLRDVVNGGVEFFPNMYLGIIVRNSETESCNYIIASSDQDCNIIAGQIRDNRIGKCGGSPAMIQGSSDNYNMLIEYLKKL